MYSLSKKSEQRLEGIDPRLIEVIKLALQITKVDFGIPAYGGLRTEEEQNKLYCDELSKCDGYVKRSRHQDGAAFDIFAYTEGKASWDEKDLAMCATAILQAASQLGTPLTWGGNWKNFCDMPHFELAR